MLAPLKCGPIPPTTTPLPNRVAQLAGAAVLFAGILLWSGGGSWSFGDLGTGGQAASGTRWAGCCVLFAAVLMCGQLLLFLYVIVAVGFEDD